MYNEPMLAQPAKRLTRQPLGVSNPKGKICLIRNVQNVSYGTQILQ
jgi:hypothetical protein